MEVPLSAAPYYPREHTTFMLTAGGWARSGKGTSMAHLRGCLEAMGNCVELIDQGIKFRAMGEVAIFYAQPMDSELALNAFVCSAIAQDATLRVLSEVSTMTEEERKARLYTTEISKASGKIGRVPNAHLAATGLLRSQVMEAVETNVDVVLIDGRSMERYARQFTQEGLAEFVIGWFFKCDPAIAARRSLGLFDEFQTLSAENRHRLLEEILNISDRNGSDTLRSVDPIQEPVRAYHLDLKSYTRSDSDPLDKRTRHILGRDSLAVVDTSYTNSIEDMTGPITELSQSVLLAKGLVRRQDTAVQTAIAV